MDRTPGIVVVVKTFWAGSPLAMPSVVVSGAPPIDSYIVVRRNMPPTVHVCGPFSQMRLFEKFHTGLLRGIGMTSFDGCGDVIVPPGNAMRRPPCGS